MKVKGNQNFFNLLKLLGSAICFFGIYLDVYHNIKFARILIFIGALITFVFYIIEKKGDV